MVCLKCGTDSAFMWGCPGLCLVCFDAFQQLSKPELITRLAKAILEIERLEAMLKPDCHSA